MRSPMQSLIQRTKINNIKYLEAFVNASRRKKGPIMTDSHCYDGTKVGAIVLHKFQTSGSLFPKLDVAINGSCNEEIGWCDSNKVDRVPVHQGAFVEILVRQMIKVQGLMLQDWFVSGNSKTIMLIQDLDV